MPGEIASCGDSAPLVPPTQPPSGLARVVDHDFVHPELLTEALTHPSALFAEHGRARRAKPARRSYDRLEFLGDRVLGLVVADLLWRRFEDEPEGLLTRRHTHLVRRETLARVADTIGLGAHLILSPRRDRRGHRRKSRDPRRCLRGGDRRDLSRRRFRRGGAVYSPAVGAAGRSDGWASERPKDDVAGMGAGARLGAAASTSWWRPAVPTMRRSSPWRRVSPAARPLPPPPRPNAALKPAPPPHCSNGWRRRPERAARTEVRVAESVDEGLAIYDVPRAVVEPLLRSLRMYNTAADALFYDVCVLWRQLFARGVMVSTDIAAAGSPQRANLAAFRAMAEHVVNLSALTDPEGVILVVDARQAPFIERYADVGQFLQNRLDVRRCLGRRSPTAEGGRAVAGSGQNGLRDRSGQLGARLPPPSPGTCPRHWANRWRRSSPATGWPTSSRRG